MITRRINTVSWSWSAIRCSYGMPGGNRFSERLTSSMTWLYSGWDFNSSRFGAGSTLFGSTPTKRGHTWRRRSSNFAEFKFKSIERNVTNYERGGNAHRLLIHNHSSRTFSTLKLVCLDSKVRLRFRVVSVFLQHSLELLKWRKQKKRVKRNRFIEWRRYKWERSERWIHSSVEVKHVIVSLCFAFRMHSRN